MAEELRRLASREGEVAVRSRAARLAAFDPEIPLGVNVSAPA